MRWPVFTCAISGTSGTSGTSAKSAGDTDNWYASSQKQDTAKLGGGTGVDKVKATRVSGSVAVHGDGIKNTNPDHALSAFKDAAGECVVGAKLVFEFEENEPARAVDSVSSVPKKLVVPALRL